MQEIIIREDNKLWFEFVVRKHTEGIKEAFNLGCNGIDERDSKEPSNSKL